MTARNERPEARVRWNEPQCSSEEPDFIAAYTGLVSLRTLEEAYDPALVADAIQSEQDSKGVHGVSQELHTDFAWNVLAGEAVEYIQGAVEYYGPDIRFAIIAKARPAGMPDD